VSKHWKREDVTDWLKLVQLEEYTEVFETEKVDGLIVLSLTEDNIKSSPYNMKPTHAHKFMELRKGFY
jgi:hypothetical protein